MTEPVPVHCPNCQGQLVSVRLTPGLYVECACVCGQLSIVREGGIVVLPMGGGAVITVPHAQKKAGTSLPA